MRPLLKVMKDLWATRGRVLFMVVSLAAGLSAMGSVLIMRTVVQRAMRVSYLDSVPASATFDVGEAGLSDKALAALRARPEVAWAERRATLEGRWRHPDGVWGRALFFVREDFADPRLATLGHEAGAGEPGPGEVLVERSAMGVLGASVGDTVEVVAPGGNPVPVRIVGVAHEPALAPAATEQSGYFYLSPATLAALSPRPVLDEVRILVAESPLSLPAVEAQVRETARWLEGQGVALHEVRIPPPGEHPHEAPSQAVLFLFWIWAGLTVVLAAVLTASLLAVTLARQVREVAVMKTLGARAPQIGAMYLAMLGVIAGLALLVSIVPTWALARAGTDAVTTMLNLEVASYAVPGWILLLQVAVGLGLPLLIATPVIVGASRRTVRAALDDHGASAPSARLATGLGGLKNQQLRAALTGALRVPRRLALTVGLLAVGGGLFIAATSVADAWDALTGQVLVDRRYDVEVTLASPVTPEALAIAEAAGTTELWGRAPVTFVGEDGLPVSRTYPDGGHGSFHLMAAPDDSTLMDFHLRAGRRLEPGERGGVVLNQLAAARLGKDPVGQVAELVVEGTRHTWTVVGVVDEVAAPATAYVSQATWRAEVAAPLQTLRVDLDAEGAEATAAAIGSLQKSLEAQGVRIARAAPLTLLYNAMGEHVVVLVNALLGLALLMALVGVLALASTMSTSIVERTRELGVLQAVGARPAQVRWMLVLEGWFMTALSLPVALVVGAPLAAGVGRLVGNLSFRLPLPLDLAWHAVLAWSLGVLLVAAVAAFVPARAATRLTVREAVGRV